MEPESTTHSTSTPPSLAWIVAVTPTICIGMQSSLGRSFEPLFPSTAWFTAVERGAFSFNAGSCLLSDRLFLLLPPCWFCLLLLGRSLRRWVRDPDPKHPGCHHCWLPMDSWEMACCCLSRTACWHWICFARIFCPTTSSLITFGRSAALFTSSQVTLWGGFLLWPHAQQPFLGASLLVNPALDLISDLLEGFGRVVSDSALDISSELGICQVLQKLVS